MIKASVLNFVRGRADEAKQFADLHATLTELSNQEGDIKRNTAKLAELKAARDELDTHVKNAQEHLAALHQEHDAVRDHAAQIKKDADDYSAAKQAAAVNTIRAANIHATEIMTNADHVLENKNKEILQKGEALQKVSADVESKKKELDELTAKHGELQRKHDALMRGLDALKPSL